MSLHELKVTAQFFLISIITSVGVAVVAVNTEKFHFFAVYHKYTVGYLYRPETYLFTYKLTLRRDHKLIKIRTFCAPELNIIDLCAKRFFGRSRT